MTIRRSHFRLLVIVTLLIVPASGHFASADQSATPATHGEWLDRLFAASIDGGFSDVSAGYGHSCGLKINGSIECWGDNNEGQTDVPDGSYMSVAAGGNFSCGLKADATLACWGHNIVGQTDTPTGTFTSLSAGFVNGCGVRTDTSIECWGAFSEAGFWPVAGTYSKVSVGMSHACGLKIDQSIVCWGTVNTSGQQDAPTGTFTDVSAGQEHTCALRTNQTVICWGDNSEGQRSVPAGTYTRVSVGFFHSCGLKIDAAIVCWGTLYNNGNNAAPSGSFGSVSAGSTHTCGAKTNGLVVCWGNNGHGQAAEPDPSDQRTISDAGVEQYVTDAENARDIATFLLAARTIERDQLLSAPACELLVPKAGGTNARVNLNKTISGTVRWISPATKANVGLQITRVVGGVTQYWVSGATWSSTITTKTVAAGTTYAGTREAPWKIAFPMPAGIGNTYSVSCKATDTLGNTSPTPDSGKLIGIA